jgi:rod shape-determining protein MreC
MQNFSAFFSKYRVFITFTLLVIISFFLITTGDVSKIGGFRTFLVGFYGQMQNAMSWIPNAGALKSENRALRNLNLELSSEVIKMRNALFENEKLRKLLDFQEETAIKSVSAEIVGKSTIEMRNYLTINKGRNDSISAGMPVRTDAGLAGIVVSATKNYALVEVLTNRHIKVAAKLLRTDFDGLLVWNGNEYFKLNNIPNTYDVKKGDEVITSNLSNKYPKEVPIGEIIKVNEDPSSLFYDITVKPYVNFASINEVFVMLYLPEPERHRLIEQMKKDLELLMNK